MIVIYNIAEPEQLFRIHSLFEHTDPLLQNTFVIHFEVGLEEFQYIYVAQLWSDVIPKIMEYWKYASNGITVVVVNADLMTCEVPPDIDEYPKIPEA